MVQHASVFEGLGEFSGEHYMHTDPRATPVRHGCWKIPLAGMDRVKATLDDLLEADVEVCVTKRNLEFAWTPVI